MAGAPTDPAFYQAVDAMATRLGAKAEDLLWVWASETAFDTTLKGDARTMSTLMHGVVDSGLLTQAEWDSLPTLSATKQLPFIERYYKLFKDHYLGGRGFQDTFEVYMVNAAPALLRPDGQYNPRSTMYGDPNQAGQTVAWEANWPMDNFPIARTESASRGAALVLSFGQQLVSEGLLKGWITLGDLRSFMLRPDVAAIANVAIQNLRAVRAGAGASGVIQAGLSTDVTPYAPDASKSFGNPQAPIDVRIAPSLPTPQPALSPVEFIALAVVAWFAVRWMSK